MAILVLALGVGLAAGPGQHDNLTTAVLWLAWFPLFIYFSAAVAGEAWCRACCPLPALFRAVGTGRSHRLPAWLAGGLPAAIGFIVVVRWVTPHFEVSASPLLTAWFFLAWIAAGLLMARRYAATSFCGTACPTGAMLRLYGRSSLPALWGARRARQAGGELNAAEAALAVASVGIFPVAMTLHHRWSPAPLHRAADAWAALTGLSHARAMFDVTFVVGLAVAFAGFGLASWLAARLAGLRPGRAFRGFALAAVPLSLFSGLSHAINMLLTQGGNVASAALTQAGVAVYVQPALLSPPVAEALGARFTGPLWWVNALGYAAAVWLAWRTAVRLTAAGGSLPGARCAWRAGAAFLPILLAVAGLLIFREYATLQGALGGGMEH